MHSFLTLTPSLNTLLDIRSACYISRWVLADNFGQSKLDISSLQHFSFEYSWSFQYNFLSVSVQYYTIRSEIVVIKCHLLYINITFKNTCSSVFPSVKSCRFNESHDFYDPPPHFAMLICVCVLICIYCVNKGTRFFKRIAEGNTLAFFTWRGRGQGVPLAYFESNFTFFSSPKFLEFKQMLTLSIFFKLFSFKIYFLGIELKSSAVAVGSSWKNCEIITV